MNEIICGDALSVLKTLDAESIDCVITSPPYWALRDYGVAGQLGLEPTFQEYITKLCDIFDEVKRVLKKEGTCWVNMGDTYGGTGDKGDWKDPKYKEGRNGQVKAINKSAVQKSLCQIPSRFAIETTNRGWILRNSIVWHKPNCMPSSVKDRFTVDYEMLYFFVKSKKYYFEQQHEKAVSSEDRPHGIVRDGEYDYDSKQKVLSGRGGGKKASGAGHKNLWKSGLVGYETRNVRSVWTIATKPYAEAHFATYPEALCETPIRAGCPVGGLILDPFFGAGTTGVVAKKLGRNYLGVELSRDYCVLAQKRIDGTTPPLL